MNSLVSVVMPCYNSDSYLEHAINSVLDQTHTNLELIIVNDGSTDATDAILRSYRDPRVKICRFAQNKGNYFARNYGMKRATGRFVCVMDADDISCPDRLRIQYEYFVRSRDIGCLGGQGIQIDSLGNTVGPIEVSTLPSRQLAPLFTNGNFMIHSTAMFDKEKIGKFKLRYRTRFRYSADFELFGRATAYFQVFNLDVPLVYYRRHPNQISIAKRDMQETFADAVRIARVREFGISLSAAQLELYLKLVKLHTVFSFKSVEQGISIFDRILDKNQRMLRYEPGYLFELFEYYIAHARNHITE